MTAESVKKEKIRLFTGIPIPTHFSEMFQFFANSNTSAEGIRWIKSDNWHITVSFIGAVSTDRLDFIKEQMNKLSASIAPFPLTFNEIYFHRANHPKMIWAKFIKNESFIKLVQLSNELLELDPKNNNRISPHATLARLKKPVNQDVLDFNHPIINPVLEVKKLVLWESRINNRGAEYIPIEEFHLK